MATSFKKIIRCALPYAVFGVVLFALMNSAQAAGYLGTGWDKYLGGMRTFSPSDKTGQELAIDLVKNLVRILRYVIGFIAALVAVIYGVMLVFARGKEDVIEKQRENLLWLGVGFIVLILAENVAVLLQPEQAATGALIDYTAANDQLRSMVNYLKYVFGFILLVLAVISGARLMTAGGEEDKITEQKRNLSYIGIGMLVVMLTDEIVSAVYVLKAPNEVVIGDTTQTISNAANLIRLFLAFLGPLAVVMTIAAGFYYLTSLDNEDQEKKGRQLVAAGISGIIVIYAASAIVNTVIQSQLNP